MNKVMEVYSLNKVYGLCVEAFVTFCFFDLICESFTLESATIKAKSPKLTMR